MAARPSASRKDQVRENPVRALAKAVHLLEQLAEAREATPRRLAELLDEPRTTTYRLLRSLEDLFGLDHLGYAADPALPAFDNSVYNRG